MGGSREPLTIDGYCLKITRIIHLLEDDTALKSYPYLSHLLNRKRHGHGTNRDLLITLVRHMQSAVRRYPSEAIYDASGTITAYAITISIRFIGKLWGMTKETANKTVYLFTATGLINRSRSESVQARELSEKSQEEAAKDFHEVARSIGDDRELPHHYMFRYWVDGWTPGQLQEKESRAAKQGDKTTGLERTDVITIHGQRMTTAISENGSGKSKQQLKTEQRVVRAYKSVISRKEYPVVSKAEMLEELTKQVPIRPHNKPTQAQETERRWTSYQQAQEATDRKWKGKTRTKEDFRKEVRQEYREEYERRRDRCLNSWWKKGKLALMVQEELAYRQLTAVEKKMYGIKAGRGERFLVPEK